MSDDSAVVRFARPSHAPGLELVHYPHLTRGWRGIPESYTWFTMIPRLVGDVDVISRGMRSRCEPGSLTVGEPGEPYVLQPRSAMRGEFRVVRLDNALEHSYLEQLGMARRGGSPFPVAPQHDPRLARAFFQLYRAVDTGERLEVQERLFSFLVSLTRQAKEKPKPGSACGSRAVRRARDLLHARFDANVSLEELSSAAGAEKFTLLRAFTRELGITPHAYMVHLRMARACQLIAQGDPLAEVALAVGYSEQSALARQFRRLVGVTPGEYARAVR